METSRRVFRSSQNLCTGDQIKAELRNKNPKCPEARERWSENLWKIAPNEQDDKGYSVCVNALPCLDRYTADWRGPLTQRRDP